MKIFIYILKNHVGPFLFAVFTLIAIFLLQFLMKFADRLVGKGLGVGVIIKLISYNLAWMVVLVVPMAVLVATLMAFGSMAQNNEIAILKSSGMSLYKMMAGPLLASFIIAYLLVQFNNHVYPNANHAARILMQDISRKKPTLSLVPGVFSQEVRNYAILAREVDPKTNVLKNIVIYDQSDPRVLNIITAKRGKIYFSKNREKLILDLWNGEIQQSNRINQNFYRKMIFKRDKISMNAENFSFRQSSFAGPRGDRELSAQDMLVIVKRLKKVRGKYFLSLNKNIMKFFNDSFQKRNLEFFGAKLDTNLILLRVSNKVNTIQSNIASVITSLRYNKDRMNSYWVEIYKKYSIPFACIIFILIGAPLGTMTRKGGFGYSAGISLVFFLIYWAFLIGGEKLSDRGMLSPFWGMWSANIFLGILGILFTIKSARGRVTIKFNIFKKLIPKQWRLNPEDN